MGHAKNPSSITLTRKGERAIAAHQAERALAINEKRRIRKEAAEQVDALLGILDRLDGDPDLEPGSDEEPSAGWPVSGPAAVGFANDHTHGEGEQDDCDLEENGDKEPSLGSNGGGYDCQDDPAEHGIGDYEALVEAWGGNKSSGHDVGFV